jgi:hypothetical protein
MAVGGRLAAWPKHIGSTYVNNVKNRQHPSPDSVEAAYRQAGHYVGL